jgi:trans-aconitate 2-methyltransferase
MPDQTRTAWDPRQYLRFAGHRLRPAIDLLDRIDLSGPETVFDLGCGAGNVTVLLRERWPAAAITGVDGSADMLAKARETAPAIDWVETDMAGWAPDAPVDLIYSNAALHWLGGHDTLFPRLIEGLAPGGVLAVQMPRNFGAPSHTAMADAARAGPWRATLEPLLKPSPVAEPAFYYDVVAPHVAALDIWESEYLQVLDGDDPVAEWTKGTWLRPLLDALDEPDRAGFEAEYRARVRQAYPRRADGKTLFPFRRLFLVAVR